MMYRSTRSEHSVSAPVAILTGLAPDGGLYVPRKEDFPVLPWEGLTKKSLPEIVADLIAAFFPELGRESEALAKKAYEGKFDHPAYTPTVSLGDDLYLTELFHGPTAAFKDVALSLLPHLLAASKNKLGIEGDVTVLTATSGDTGKAALEGFKDVPGTRIVVFYPAGGVSRIQRAQMVTQEGQNVAVAGILGNFDDAQTGVKEIFRRRARDEKVLLSSANSINIGRLVPQMSYYFKAYGDLVSRGAIQLGDKVDFAVPTGNFGDILAGYLAKRMGLPVGKLICASNANDVLTDFIRTGVYDRRRPFIRTTSPSMDILVSSNLERMLFFLCEDEKLVAELMDDLACDGAYQLPDEMRGKISDLFYGARATDEEAAQALEKCFRESGYAADPHTAVALRAVTRYRAETGAKTPVVTLGTASPYKFSPAVLKALGEDAEGDEFDLIRRLKEKTGVPVPRGLAALDGKEERHTAVIEREEMEAFALGQTGEKS